MLQRARGLVTLCLFLIRRPDQTPRPQHFAAGHLGRLRRIGGVTSHEPPGVMACVGAASRMGGAPPRRPLTRAVVGPGRMRRLRHHASVPRRHDVSARVGDSARRATGGIVAAISDRRSPYLARTAQSNLRRRFCGDRIQWCALLNEKRSERMPQVMLTDMS